MTKTKKNIQNYLSWKLYKIFLDISYTTRGDESLNHLTAKLMIEGIMQRENRNIQGLTNFA